MSKRRSTGLPRAQAPLDPLPIFILLGSNIEPELNLREAVRLLAEKLPIKRVSRVYESTPIDARGKANPEQPNFLNAAVLIESDLTVLELKQSILLKIEHRLGRKRTADKYAPRPIDLDIVLYGDHALGLVIEYADGQTEMIIPDRDTLTHAFIALPLADLDPDFIHPLTGETLGQIAARFDGTPGISLHSLTLEA
ncbi:MAG: 2-amino-4-hydroxy-6-hydroxymethyldihydropteridine diphosphokinase [Anaerolineae bacterium]|nr:2-amino-4-hydroxy-6-hydroxymethyldihydropteridine diphosphokinase [Anaerolineae bacterium]